MSFAAFLAAAPTPAKKRSRPADTAPQHRDEENMVKLLAKVSSVVLSEQRNQASRIGHTLLLPAEHEMTVGLTEVKDRYAATQPAREEGKPGKKHPWGAPRNVNTAQFIEITLALYAKDNSAALRAEAIRIWGQEHLQALTTKVGRLVTDCVSRTDSSPMDPLCQFFRYRVARSGQGILEITGGTGRCFDEVLRVYELQGLPLEDLWGMLLMPYATYVTKGPAPQGRLERQINKMVYSKK